jgi:molybdopterin converting factor small subunit
LKIKVRSFAGFRHLLGKEMQVELGEDATVLHLLETLCASRPALRLLLFSGEDLLEDVNIFVAGKNIASRQGRQTRLADGMKWLFFPRPSADDEARVAFYLSFCRNSKSDLL